MPGIRKLVFKQEVIKAEAEGLDALVRCHSYMFILKGLEVGVGHTDYTEGERQASKTYFGSHADDAFSLCELRSLFVLRSHEGASFHLFALEEAFFKNLSDMLEAVSWSGNTVPIEVFNQENRGCYSLIHKQEERTAHIYALGDMRLFKSKIYMMVTSQDTQVEINVSRYYQHV